MIENNYNYNNNNSHLFDHSTNNIEMNIINNRHFNEQNNDDDECYDNYCHLLVDNGHSNDDDLFRCQNVCSTTDKKDSFRMQQQKPFHSNAWREMNSKTSLLNANTIMFNQNNNGTRKLFQTVGPCQRWATLFGSGRLNFVYSLAAVFILINHIQLMDAKPAAAASALAIELDHYNDFIEDSRNDQRHPTTLQHESYHSHHQQQTPTSEHYLRKKSEDTDQFESTEEIEGDGLNIYPLHSTLPLTLHNSDLITASENEPKVSVVDDSLFDSQSMVSGGNNNAENEEEILDPELNKATLDSIEGINPNQKHQHQSKTFTNMMANMMENLTENVIRLNQTGIDCISVRTEPGIYALLSETESNFICGLYLMANPSQIVVIEFLHFDVSCHKNGLLSVVNGWELMGEFFPSLEDHPLPRNARYHEFCGHQKPKKVFRMSQNVGLLEYRIPTPGQGFIAKVTFVENPKPCNTIIRGLDFGIYTIRNYGRRINCTMSILFGSVFQVLSLNVGQSYRRLDNIIHSPRSYVAETGLVRKCKKRGMSDYVEFRGGNGLDTQLMQIGEDVCGFKQFPYKHRISLFCNNSAVRLVSSGQYDNQIEFYYEPLLDLPTSPLSLMCPPPPTYAK